MGIAIKGIDRIIGTVSTISPRGGASAAPRDSVPPPQQRRQPWWQHRLQQGAGLQVVHAGRSQPQPFPARTGWAETTTRIKLASTPIINREANIAFSAERGILAVAAQ